MCRILFVPISFLVSLYTSKKYEPLFITSSLRVTLKDLISSILLMSNESNLLDDIVGAGIPKNND